jgi:proline iminopeptidase
VREGRIPIGGASLYFREIGAGRPILVLHGGPDFDHRYFLPELDRLSDSYRLIYYDQRGRGMSADGVEPEDVTLESEVDDLERVRQAFDLESIAILGHSWGALLALEYAIRHPERVSHLILMNPAPASSADLARWREERLRAAPGDMEERKALAASSAYRAGDREAVAAYYRVHFRRAVARPEHLERVIAGVTGHITPEGVIKARRIEDRLMAQTWLSDRYDLHPALGRLSIPALVIHGDHDFIPAASAAAPIARALPQARSVSLSGCGHFAFLECPDAVRAEIDRTFRADH